MENKIVIHENSFQRMEKKPKELGTVYHRSLWKDIVNEIKSNPVAVFAVIFLIIIIKDNFYKSCRKINLSSILKIKTNTTYLLSFLIRNFHLFNT